jgi:hypothetical protein
VTQVTALLFKGGCFWQHTYTYIQAHNLHTLNQFASPYVPHHQKNKAAFCTDQKQKMAESKPASGADAPTSSGSKATQRERYSTIISYVLCAAVVQCRDLAVVLPS